MVELTAGQVAEYFRRSYTAVDGLWFMKAEEALGFDAALDIDAAVWRVMPKIQARKLKALTGLEQGAAALRECFTTKLAIEQYAFSSQAEPDGGFSVRIHSCPWVELLEKSGRAHLAEQVGRRICDAEYAVWAAEFGAEPRVEFGDRICAGCSSCTIRFRAGHPE